MNKDRILLGDLLRLHYGAALKAEERAQNGAFEVFGSSGQVGHHNRALVEHATIIIGRKGSVGSITYAPYGGWAIDTAFYVEPLHPEKTCLRYMFHALSAADLKRHAITTSIPGLSRDGVYRTAIRFPPLQQQYRIAEVLDKVEAIRQKRREAVALTEELVRSTFLDVFGDPVRNPKEWPICTLEDLSREVVDCPHSTPVYAGGATAHPCVRTSDLQNGFLDWSTTKFVSSKEYTFRIERLKPEVGDVVYSREGERFGIAALVPSNVELCLGQRMMIFRVDVTSATPEFLWALLNTRGVYQQAKNRVGGSTSPHVNVRDIRAFHVFRPPLELQRQFAAVVKLASRARARMLDAASRDDELFGSLVAEAFHEDQLVPNASPSRIRALGTR